MPEQLYTRCPACETVFRVTPTQLAMRAGQVRCGHCQTVFDGNAQLVPAVPTSSRRAVDSPAEGYDEAAMGPPTMTLRAARPADPAPATGPQSDAALAAGPVEYEQRFTWDRTERRRRGLAVAFAIGVPVLLLLLLFQGVFHFRDLIGARWPAARPALAAMCEVVGCAVQAPRNIDGLAIEGSELQADPAHRGLLILTATLRNRSSLAIGYPYLELALTDARDQTVASRALAPRDYAPANADLGEGIGANVEVPIKLFVDASATHQAGYRLYLFYP